MERVLQTLGLTTKSHKRSDGYYGSGRPNFGSHSNYQSTVSGGGARKPRPDDLTWVELTHNRDSDDSAGNIVNRHDDILVTTEFATVESHRSGQPVSSAASQSSVEGRAGPGSAVTDIESAPRHTVSPDQ